jgi:hypothetical protein
VGFTLNRMGYNANINIRYWRGLVFGDMIKGTKDPHTSASSRDIISHLSHSSISTINRDFSSTSFPFPLERLDDKRPVFLLKGEGGGLD